MKYVFVKVMKWIWRGVKIFCKGAPVDWLGGHDDE